jgi:hypothetical protein
VAFLDRAFVGAMVVGFTLFSVAVHPTELHMGLLCFVSNFLSVSIRARREEVQLLKVPAGVLK